MAIINYTINQWLEILREVFAVLMCDPEFDPDRIKISDGWDPEEPLTSPLIELPSGYELRGFSPEGKIELILYIGGSDLDFENPSEPNECSLGHFTSPYFLALALVENESRSILLSKLETVASRRNDEQYWRDLYAIFENSPHTP